MSAWTPQDVFIVRTLYANTPNAELAAIVGRSPRNVGQFARKHGLKKSPEFIERERPGQFAPGNVSHNKGLRRPGWAPGRMAATQFKRGQMSGAAQHNYVPIGTVKVRDGLLCRKLTDDQAIYPAGRWRPVHTLAWEAVNGPVPSGLIAVFKPGRKTLDADAITADDVEVITRAENMRRNSYHTRYPELAPLIQLRGALNRKINRRAKA